MYLERIYGRSERRDIEFVATNRAPSTQRWLSSAWLSVQVNKPPPTRPSPVGDSTGYFDRGRSCVRARTRVHAARSAGGFSASSPRSRSPAASPTRARMAGRAQSAASRGCGEERPRWRHAHVRYWMLRRPASRPAVLETVRPPSIMVWLERRTGVCCPSPWTRADAPHSGPSVPVVTPWAFRERCHREMTVIVTRHLAFLGGF
jgi:hypothetical protein